MAITFRTLPRLAGVFGLLALTAACVPNNTQVTMLSARPDLLQPGLNPNFVAKAVGNAKAQRAKGQKIWCVPFARDASGIDIQGDARTWWDQAKGRFVRSNQPAPGAVMAFKATRKLPIGHIAVVSKLVSDREILVDHANWKPSQVTLGMSVFDVSPGNDWSMVRVASVGDTLGRPYPVDGFIAAPPPSQVALMAPAP